VEWMNTDSTEPHTVTFGPPSFTPVNVTTAADGSLESSISSTSAAVSSGILQAALEDRTGLAQSPLGTTRIRVTFTQPGTYQYICSIHAGTGMKGTVQVVP
jgi:plastocyanin